MKELLCLIAILAVASPCRCAAELVVSSITKKNAKELGVEMRFKPGPGEMVWVEFEFKTEGELATFAKQRPENRIELTTHGKKEDYISHAVLREERADGRVRVRFAAHRDKLDQVRLMVVSYARLGGTGWRIAPGRFFDQEKPAPAKEHPAKPVKTPRHDGKPAARAADGGESE